MTFYEVACKLHHNICGVAEAELRDYAERALSTYRQIEQESIDECYVLGEIIDSMPVELAEREV